MITFLEYKKLHCIENFMKGMKFKMLELEENIRLLEELKAKLQNLGESL